MKKAYPPTKLDIRTALNVEQYWYWHQARFALHIVTYYILQVGHAGKPVSNQTTVIINS